MASVVSLNRVVLLALVVSMLLSSACSTVVDLNLKPEHYAAPKRDAVMFWYDETHLIHYDLRGPVRSIRRVIQVDGQSVEWRWDFNRQGRLSSQGQTHDGVQTRYRYDNQHRLREVIKVKDGVDTLSRVYQYRGNALHTVAIKDVASGGETRIEYDQQPISSGYFVSSHIRFGVGDPRDQHFSDDGALLWSSHSAHHTGPDQAYNIPTHDQVTSPKIESRGSTQMRSYGGYHYENYPDGRLAAVTSHNANKQQIYHRTDYRYSIYGLLLEENKHVSGYSVFNSASDMSAVYRYQMVDRYGNWLKRIVSNSSKQGVLEMQQERFIDYWD